MKNKNSIYIVASKQPNLGIWATFVPMFQFIWNFLWQDMKMVTCTNYTSYIPLDSCRSKAIYDNSPFLYSLNDIHWIAGIFLKTSKKKFRKLADQS